MSQEQCWSVQANGSRCREFAPPGAFFCSRHRHVRASEVARIWLVPEAEMPPELVAALRRSAPEISFPALRPGPASDAGASAGGPGQPRSGDPVSAPGEGAAPEPGDPSDRSDPSDPSDRTGTSAAASSLGEAGPTVAASFFPGDTGGSRPLDWLLSTLQAAIEGVMAGDATPLQKANAVARLTGQYLKVCRAQELEREPRELGRRLAAAEARVAELERRFAALDERPGEAPAELAAGLAITRRETTGAPAAAERDGKSRPMPAAAELMLTLHSEQPPEALVSWVDGAALAAGAAGRDPP